MPPGLGRGTIWAWPTFLDSGNVTDEWCRTTTIPPAVAMQAHSAPLGIVFYNYTSPDQRPPECDPAEAFPAEMDGFAFISFHGSWDRNPPTGYKVVYVAMDQNGTALGQPVDLLAHKGPNAQWEDGFRPVGVDFDPCGRLLVSSDGAGNGAKIVRIIHIASNSSQSTPCASKTCQPIASSSSKVVSSSSKVKLGLLALLGVLLGGWMPVN